MTDDWWGLAPGHRHSTVDEMWNCQACMTVHKKWTKSSGGPIR